MSIVIFFSIAAVILLTGLTLVSVVSYHHWKNRKTKKVLKGQESVVAEG